MSQPKRLLLLLACLHLVGCASMVSEYLQKAGSVDYQHVATNEKIEQLGFTKQTFCAANLPCIRYFIGEPLTNNRLAYQTQISATQSTTKVSLDLDRNTISAFPPSTIVLMHGFRSSKEFMLNSALYFRFLGFRVLVPDLLGHGESEGDKSFGVADAAVINSLIESTRIPNQDLYLLGNSMGAVAVVHIAQMRDDIGGIILQAPMIAFDQAVIRYAHAHSPTMAWLIGDDNLSTGARSALDDVKITMGDTDILRLLGTLPVPSLILASSDDPVSPFDYFAHLASTTVRVENLPNRNHPSMSIVGQDSSMIILDWLEHIHNSHSPTRKP